MFSSRTNLVKLKKLQFLPPMIFLYCREEKPMYNHTQRSNYVDVKMKWKKDHFLDSIDVIHKSRKLKSLIAIKDCIITQPDYCIPISAISKKGPQFGIRVKVACFLRKHPSFFEEFTGPQYNLPWFRLTPEAIELDSEERVVYEENKIELVNKIKKLVLMTKERKLPLKAIQGLHWNLGIPDDFLKSPETNLDSSFKVVEMEDGIRGLSVDTNEKVLSVMQQNAAKRVKYSEYNGSLAPLAFPLIPSKGVRLKRKISSWLEEFQKLPYVSPYEDSSKLNTNSDLAEKRLVGILHEVLSLFVDHSVERRKLFGLRGYVRVPHTFYKAFERHPHMFYLSLRNKTCTVILKEAYNGNSAIESHPILKVRKKYIRLMEESKIILKNRQHRKKPNENANCSLDESVDSETEVKYHILSRCTQVGNLTDTTRGFKSSTTFSDYIQASLLGNHSPTFYHLRHLVSSIGEMKGDLNVVFYLLYCSPNLQYLVLAEGL